MISERSQSPLVVVGVPNRNGRELLKRHMPSLVATDYSNFRIALADNASADDSVEFVRQHFSSCAVIASRRDRGFAGNVNRLLRYGLDCQAKYIAIVSNDVTVPPAWLTSAVQILEDAPDIGILGFTEVAARNRLDFPETIRVVSTIYPTGCAFILRTALVRRIGFYDETLYMYGEEQDYYPRIAKAGFTLAKTNIPVHHQGQGYSRHVSKQTLRLCYRNAIYCALKNFGIVPGLIVSAKIFCYAVLPDFLLRRLRTTSLADLANNATLSERSADAVDTTGLLRAHSPAFRLWSYLLAVTWNIFHLPATFAKRNFVLGVSANG